MRLRPFDILLVVLVVVLGAGLSALRAIVGSSVLETLQEFDVRPPLVTVLALHPGSLVVALLAMSAMLFAGVRALARDVRGRGIGWMVAALGLGLAFGVFFVAGVYGPVLSAH